MNSDSTSTPSPAPEVTEPEGPRPAPAMSEAPAGEAPSTEAPSSEVPKLDTFAGVYRPIVLTILGAMLYLREGWLVGNAGLLGALLVIFAAFTITGTTALSVSSIATNLRLRAGGAFAVISASLGLEAGGAIGVPLFIAQTISSVMYLFAFAEAWSFAFPSHPSGIVVGVGFVVVAAVVLTSQSLAARAQGAMLVILGVAMTSVVLAWGSAPTQWPSMVGRFEQASLFECFAIFFPAATGIMVGAGMSGSLASPSRSIPKGTMSAWLTTLVIYVVGAFWYATVVPRDVLLTDKLAMIEHSAVPILVLVGLICSTVMAALSSLVAAPLLLQAMAEHGVVPGSRWLKQIDARGRPFYATLATLGVAALGLSAGSLDAIAPVITSFFVMTYLAINVVVFLEQALGMVSWRPMFQIPTLVPAVGAVACTIGLVLSSPAGGLPEVLFVTGIYVWLARRRRIDTPWETVQSGAVQTLAAWAALKAAQMGRSPRTWKPDLLVPVASAEEALALAPVCDALIAFKGSVKLVAVVEDQELAEALDRIVATLRARGRFASWHLMPEEELGQAARHAMNAMQGTFFAPNLILLSASLPDAVTNALVDHARKHQLGAILYLPEEDVQDFVAPEQVVVWISDRSPDWELGLQVANLDLPILLAYLLTRPTEGHMRLATVLRDAGQTENAAKFLGDVVELGRLRNAETLVVDGDFREAVGRAPEHAVHLFGLPQEIHTDSLRELAGVAKGACLFVLDSGQESALA